VHSRLAPGKCVLNRERVQDETERKQPPNDMRDALVAHDPALPNYDISRASGRLIGERRELMAQMLSDPAIIGTSDAILPKRPRKRGRPARCQSR
jgi:hypothetical protein